VGKSIAVRFDLCPNRPTAKCIGQRVGLKMIDQDYNVLAPSPEIDLFGVTGVNLTDGLPHTVVVTYGVGCLNYVVLLH
jgi:hypothetical protein